MFSLSVWSSWFAITATRLGMYSRVASMAVWEMPDILGSAWNSSAVSYDAISLKSLCGGDPGTVFPTTKNDVLVFWKVKNPCRVIALQQRGGVMQQQ